VGAVDKYEKPMKEFLNKAMKKHESAETKKTISFFDLFPKITKIIVTELGEKPFHIRGPLNISALDSVFCVMFEEFQKIKASKLKKKYAGLRADDEFLRVTQMGTTDTKQLQDRVSIVRTSFVS
jgi:hypothetical protein